MNGYVYLIHATGTDFYKIGWTTAHPSGRLRRLQTGSPHKLELIASRIAPRRYEKILHRKFKANYSAGEWFKFPSIYKVRPYFSKNADVLEPDIKVWDEYAVAREIARQVIAYSMLEQVGAFDRICPIGDEELSNFWYITAEHYGFKNERPFLSEEMKFEILRVRYKAMELENAGISGQKA